MADTLEVSLQLSDQKVQFKGRARTNTDITMDYFPPLGEGQGYTGLELLLMSLACCSATSVVALLRKMQKKVNGLAVHASGIRKEQHPTAFHTIFLKFTVTSADAGNGDVKKAITLSEESICPVWAMLKNNVEIKTEHTIIAG
jgi:putative redox protein